MMSELAISKGLGADVTPAPRARPVTLKNPTSCDTLLTAATMRGVELVGCVHALFLRWKGGHSMTGLFRFACIAAALLPGECWAALPTPKEGLLVRKPEAAAIRHAFRFALVRPEFFPSAAFKGLLEPGVKVPSGGGWQEIRFRRPLPARYVRVKVLSYWAMGGGLNEVQVYSQ